MPGRFRSVTALRLAAHVLSLSRVAAGVVLLILLAWNESRYEVLTLVLFAGASLTDWIDGLLARRAARPRPVDKEASDAVGRISSSPELGKWIDAGSDFLFFAAILVGLSTRGMLATWVLAPFLARELLMYGVVRPLLIQHGLDSGARTAGKAKTVLQFAATALALLMHLAVQHGAMTLATARTATSGAIGVAVAASLLSLRWYWQPLADRWPTQLRRLLHQAFATLLVLLSVQTLIWLLLRRGPQLDGAFTLSLVLWLTVAGGGLVWRRGDLRLLGDGSGDDWLPRIGAPNALTLFRLSSIPTLVLLLAVGAREGIGWLLLTFVGAVFASDLLDGRLARRSGVTSRIGKILDSASDYAALLAIASLLAWTGAVPGWLWVMITARLGLNLAATLVIVGRLGAGAATATWWGKVSVAALMVYFSLELLWSVLGAAEWVTTLMLWVERALALVLLASLADKVRYVWRSLRSRRSAGRRRSVAAAGRSAETEHA